jgi:hypothetical protein
MTPRGIALGFGISLVFGQPVQRLAHPGGLNAQGCHTNRKTGAYHCHRASATPPGTPDAAKRNGGPSSGNSGPIKKSSSGICHAPGSSYYQQTKQFTAYSSVDECVQSGGRLPR